MKSRRVASLILAVALIGTGVLVVAATPAQADWIVDGTALTGGPSLRNGKVYHDESPTFSYTLSIPSISGAASVEIKHFTVKLDWEGSATDVLASTVVITLPGNHVFNRQVTIPAVGAVSDGQHTITISATGRANGDWIDSTQTWTQPVTVGTVAQLQVVISGNPSSGAAPLGVDFTSTVSGGTPSYTYSWTFGDGTTGISPNPTHSYAAAGDFTATLTVHDALSRVAEDTFSVSVYTPLTITASSDKDSGTAKLTVHFTCSASGGSPTYSYLWNFGDGTTSTEANPSHEYSQAGDYQVTLTVTDSQSRQRMYSTSIHVDAPQGFAGLGDMGTVLVAVIVIVAVAGVVGVVLWKRKKS